MKTQHMKIHMDLTLLIMREGRRVALIIPLLFFFYFLSETALDNMDNPVAFKLHKHTILFPKTAWNSG